MRVFLSVAIAIAVALTVVAQPETDVLGTWKLDASHSRFFGMSGAPTGVLVRFERDGEVLRETLTVDRASGSSTQVINYAVNGSDRANGAGEDRIVSRLIRDKDSLTLEGRGRHFYAPAESVAGSANFDDNRSRFESGRRA